jgi:hypothetical protein
MHIHAYIIRSHKGSPSGATCSHRTTPSYHLWGALSYIE